MDKIIFATNNRHKLDELRTMLAGRYEVLSLADIGCTDDIPEDSDTFEGNAAAKALWVSRKYGISCFADDSGLEVDALGGEPGVHSARYAGVHGDDDANNALVLSRMKGQTDRRGRFRCVIALARPGEEIVFFDGSVEGEILDRLDGEGGFGYDPLFRPLGWNKSFGQATPAEKHAISHRGRAVAKFIGYLDAAAASNAEK